MIIYLAVEDKTGKVDWEYVSYMITSRPENGSYLDLIDGWSWKPFEISAV